MYKLIVMALSAVLATQVMAADSQKLTLDVTGVECGGCSKALTTALGESGLKVEGALAPAKGKASRVTATASGDVDLGAAAAKLDKQKKPHADPHGGLSLVLFAKLDDASAKKAEEALGKVKGLDGKHTKADAKKGEIAARITGGGKVTPAALVEALKGAGVAATLSHHEEKKKA